MDENFKVWHHKHVTDHRIHIDRQYRSKGSKRVVSAVSRPFQDIIEGFYYAVTGIMVEPYRGVMSEGAVGFAKGVGIGTVGLVAKPLVGVFDAFAHATDSIQDVARSANFLDKRLKPVKRRRLAYIFGPQKILMPYNHIHVKSLNFLRRFPLSTTKRIERRNELLITAELLQTQDGKEEYIIVTSERIISIGVTLIGSSLPSLKWELDFREYDQIESRVDNFYHDGVILSVEAYAHEGQHRQLEGSSWLEKSNPVDSTTRDSHPWSPKSTHSDAVSNSQDKSSRRIKPFNKVRKGTESSKKFEVIGQFQHLKVMRKIHNAICCLIRNFGSIDYDVGNLTTEEGCTSFGSIHFTEPSLDGSTDDEDIENNIIRNLDEIPWIHFDSDEDREKWRFADEQEFSEKSGGAKWLVDAKARAYFSPLSPPPVPDILNPNDDRVKKVQKLLKNGLISWQDAKTEMQLYSNEEIEKGSLRLDSPIILKGPKDLYNDKTNACMLSISDEIESEMPVSNKQNALYSLENESSNQGEVLSQREATLLEEFRVMEQRMQLRIDQLEQQVADVASQKEPSIPANMSRNLQYLPTSNTSVISALTGIGKTLNNKIEVPIHISEEPEQQSFKRKKKKKTFRRMKSS